MEEIKNNNLVSSKSRENIILYVSSLVLCLFNTLRIFDANYWADECFSILLAKMSVPDMIRATAADVHPPLYYLFLQALYHLFGDNGVTWHLSSFIPYIGIIVLGCTIVKKQFGFIPALIMNIMCSIMANPLIYNVEVRMYSLAAFFVLTAFLELYRIIKLNRILDWVVFCIASLCAAYTHYYAVILVAFFYLCLLIRMFFKRDLIKRTVSLCIITIIVYIPWLLVFIKAFERTVSGWWSSDIPSILGTIKFVIDRIPLALLYFIVIALYFIKELKMVRFNNDNVNGPLDKKNNCGFAGMRLALPDVSGISDEIVWIITGLCSFVGTAAIGLILSHLIRPLFIVRYCYPIIPALYLIFGYCLSKLKFKKRWLVISLLMISCFEIPAAYDRLSYDNYLDKETQAFLYNVSPSQDALIYTDSAYLSWILLRFYYEGVEYYSVADINEFMENEGSILDSADEKETREIWYISNYLIDEDDLRILEDNGFDLQFSYNGYFTDDYFYAYKFFI